MAGYSDWALRSICKQFHCGLTYTEVVNAAGIVHGSKPTLHLLETDPSERPAVAHIYGADPAIMAEAAVIIEKRGGFDLIDINAGCPVRKIVAKGSGAALMRDPSKIEKIVRAVTSAVALPVTVKTRSGLSPDKVNISETAHAAEAGGASAIAIHARVATQRHSGLADWELLRNIQAERTIPVIGNGGVNCPEDALRMFNETGVDAVMIGRGAIGNPWIFEEIHSLMHAETPRQHSLEEHRSIIADHLERLASLKAKLKKYQKKNATISPQGAAALQFRGHLVRYFAHFRNWSDVRQKLQTLNSIDAVMEAVDLVLSRQKQGPTVYPD